MPTFTKNVKVGHPPPYSVATDTGRGFGEATMRIYPFRDAMSVVLFATLAIVASFASAVIAYAQKSTLPVEQVLYSFQGLPDGAEPVGAVVFDSAGNLYGATTQGGSASCISVAQCGTVYELSPPTSPGGAWTETVLYIFKGNAFNDGTSPDGGLVMDSAGNLYGTTTYGGSGNCVLLGTLMGCGTVYELSPPAQTGGTWSEKVIYSFPDAIHGYKPTGDLTFDSAGKLYGATEFGGGYGTSCDPYYQNCGAIFELNPPAQQGAAWTEQVLYGFKGAGRDILSGDGAAPNGGLVLDDGGNIYGTTYEGGLTAGICGVSGVGGPGCGVAFVLTKDDGKGEERVERALDVFDGSPSGGANPLGGLLAASNGGFYGTTASSVFRLSSASTRNHVWTHKTLFEFGANAYNPAASLTLDSRGNLYGTTLSGSSFSGTVFRLSPTGNGSKWDFEIIHGFTGNPDGAHPASKLVLSREGKLYGTTQEGGTGACSFYGCGIVFEVRP